MTKWAVSRSAYIIYEIVDLDGGPRYKKKRQQMSTIPGRAVLMHKNRSLGGSHAWVFLR